MHCLILGEGFHNYHHTFPFDYATSEYGGGLNVTKAFIDLMCFVGLAQDCKRVSQDTLKARVQRTGDGSQKSGWIIFLTSQAKLNKYIWSECIVMILVLSSSLKWIKYRYIVHA